MKYYKISSEIPGSWFEIPINMVEKDYEDKEWN